MKRLFALPVTTVGLVTIPAAAILCVICAVLAVCTLPGRAVASSPRVDVVFLLDATGSMGDEISAVKLKIRDMIAAVLLGEPTPDVRFGIVAYRDRGDDFITRIYDLTRDADQIVADLAEIEANGGGDYEESVNEALHMAINKVGWDDSPDVGRLVFLIADAPPHLDYPDDYKYQDEIRSASSRAIAIHTIGASGLDENGERVFKEIAEGTGATFTWLAYQSQYVASDGDTVSVRVEGRSTTYRKGDSTWTAEGVRMGGGGYEGGGVRRGDAEMVYTAEMDGVAPTAAVTAGDAGGSSFENNLDSLIAGAVIAEAEKRGAEYASTPSAVEDTDSHAGNDGSGDTGSDDSGDDASPRTRAPVRFRLSQNFPNPFNASTVIDYEIGDPSSVRLDVFDLLGRRVRTLVADARAAAGSHQAVWSGADDGGRDLPSGNYLVKLTVGSKWDRPVAQGWSSWQSRKVLLLR